MSHPDIPLSLYVHIPWCIKKCPYCDFNSHALKDEPPALSYIDALILDATQHIDEVAGRTIQSIFIGGGTPSLLEASAYKKLFDKLTTLFSISPNVEITLEANPGTVEQNRFKAYREIGINRLSIGIQSFNPTMLERLGRIHDERAAKAAIEIAHQAGFDNFNLDIMHTLPKQTMDDARKDIETALSFSPPHLSWYQLTIEPNTYFYSHTPPLPNEEMAENIERAGESLLKDYEHYEISAFCLNQKTCQHNLNYWQFGDYLGIGAGAHGKLTMDNVILRTKKKKLPNAYLKDQTAKRRLLSDEDVCFEFMLNATRLNKTIPLSLFIERTGLTLDRLLPLLDKAKSLSLLDYSSEAFWVTHLGRRFLNDLQALFLNTNTT